MTYGSPASMARTDVAAYLARVRGGRAAGADLVDEFTRRYEVIGGSPLIPSTRRQAAALSRRLGWPVEAGMRFSEPSIETGLRRLMASGVSKVVAIILSPQYSPQLMGGYGRDVDAARALIGVDAPMVSVAGAWHDEPAFVSALASRVREALDAFPAEAAHVALSAHSLPSHVAQNEPDYLAQLDATARAVASCAGLNESEWTFCWQSAGHEPGEWMSPDFADLMPRIAAAGSRAVVIAPVQFLAEHLEVLYDVDVAARAQAEACGLAFRRARSLGDDPGLIAALEAVARRTLHPAGVEGPVA
jgi:ferrochelatase